MRLVLGSLASLALAGAAMPAAAATPDDAPHDAIVVNYGDLNLANAKGLKALDNRIEHAARTLCRVGILTTGSRIPSAQSALCFRAAMASAREQVAAASTGDSIKGG